MINEFDDYGENDLSRKRVFVISGGNIVAQCTDPYGFWHLKPEKGPVPGDLSGHYTSYDECEKAVKSYLTKKGRTLITKKETLAEVLQTAAT